MSDIKLENLSKIIPEGFYDIIAYVISAVYLIVGYLYATNQIRTIKFPEYEQSWVIDLMIVFILIGGLYVIGTIITTFSYWCILKPYKWILIKLNKDYKKSFGYWGTQNLELKINYPSLTAEMTKRYARLIMIRNITFVSFILFFVGIYTGNSKLPFIIIGGISLLTFCIRAIWLNENYEKIEDLIKGGE